VLRAQGRPEEAIPEYEAAIAFNRNWAAVSSHLGRCKFWTGSIEEGIALDEHAIRLKPTLMFRPCRGLLPRPPGPEWNLTWLRSKNFLLSPINAKLVVAAAARSLVPVAQFAIGGGGAALVLPAKSHAAVYARTARPSLRL